MNYLSPSEYGTYGLEATTPAAQVTAASSVIDAHCRRATLGLAQYEERLRTSEGRNRVRVTYCPMVAVAPATTSIVTARGRYAMPRRGEWPIDELSVDIAMMFGLPGTWVDLDPASLDVYEDAGEVTLPLNPVGLGFSELDVAYTAGWETIPDRVKVACAQIVRNLQATPALNVRSGAVDRIHLQYFADTLVDDTVKSLLALYVAQKVG